MFILKLVGKVLLIPVWMLLVAACLLVSAVVNIAGVVKSLISVVLGIMFVLTLIWFHEDWMRFVLLAVAELLIAAPLFAGAFIEVLLESITERIWDVIFL